MSDQSWTSDDIPLDRPNAARMYDYFLGGYHNFAIDRSTAEQVRSLLPDVPLFMRINRAFLRRAVTFLVNQGIDQFLDLGSGIPTVGNVHAVAQQLNPAVRVVYVDIDPIAVRHSERILQGNPNATIIEADVRFPDRILSHPKAMHMLDFSRPIGVLLVALLHFVPDDEEALSVVNALRDAVAPGSFLALSHATSEGLPRDAVQKAEELYARTTTPFKTRARAQVEHFFHGLELIEPGLVYITQWWPEGPDDLFVAQPERSGQYAGVGRKP